MTKIALNVVPDYDFLEYECPLTYALAMTQSEEYRIGTLKDEFRFPENEYGLTPFYEFDGDESNGISSVSEKVYMLLVKSLSILFSDKYKGLVPKFYGEEFFKQYPEFLDYAVYTYAQKHQPIYGRFDMAYDFNLKKILGVYESNFDTPVMYYDSVVMQNHLVAQIGDENRQYNLHFENLQKNIDSIIGNSPKNIAFLCSTKLTEDCITTETLYHAFNGNPNANCYFGDLLSLEYDFVNKDKKWFVDDLHLDYIYALMPWEEMVELFYEDSINPIKEWRLWADTTKFIEPAWRWYVSNKGVWAWLTYLKEVLALEDDSVKAFVDEHEEAYSYTLKSYIGHNHGMTNYVTKPINGRISNNISFYENGNLIAESEGYYADDTLLYQEMCETGHHDDADTKAIVCSWMSPWMDNPEPLAMEAAGLAVREFNGKILTLKNERFVPHLVNWTKDQLS